MATINTGVKNLQKVTLCALCRVGLPNPITVLFSDRQTIKPDPKAHKPADSGVPVGNDARRCSFHEVTPTAIKQMPTAVAIASRSRLFLVQTRSRRDPGPGPMAKVGPDELTLDPGEAQPEGNFLTGRYTLSVHDRVIPATFWQALREPRLVSERAPLPIIGA
ncbi:hypothetical protein [Pseudomonas moorei]|uniref:hypothetical protein n=1 Tax=Pseudomonas moorei TaxID=395599 RepID=UPI0036F3D1C8